MMKRVLTSMAIAALMSAPVAAQDMTAALAAGLTALPLDYRSNDRVLAEIQRLTSLGSE